MKNILFLFLLCLSVGVLRAKSSIRWDKLDTYEKASGNDRVVAANQLMKQLYDEGFNEAPITFHDHISPDSLDCQIFFSATEYFFYEMGDFAQVVNYADKTLALCRATGDKIREGECESILGIAYFRMGDFVQALKHAQRDLDIQRELGDRSNVSSALNTMAGIFLASRQYEEAYKYITEAIPLSTQVKDSARMAIQMGMAAEILQAMHRSDESLGFAQHAFAIDSIMGNQGKAAIRLSQMASALMDMQRDDEAQSLLLRAMPVLTQVQNKQSLAICHNQMGELMFRKKRLQAASQHYREALDFFSATGDLYNEAKARKGLYQCLRLSAPQESFLHLERFSELKDTLYSQEMKQNISLAHAKYHNEELELENYQERQHKSLVIIIGVILLIFLLIILSFLIYALKQRKRRLTLLHSLEKDKEQFFTNITHEFRTPLTVILGLSERLKAGKLHSDESAEDLAAMIERQGNTLLELVNQLLDIARSGKVSVHDDYRHGDVVGYLHMCVGTCEELARKKHISLRYTPSETKVEMDFVPDYICKILTNLLTNAIKFTPNYGNVRVSSKILKDGSHFEIRVADNGVGIEEDKIPLLFNAYTGSEGTNGEISIGIGLMLVKKLVEVLKGKIRVESKLNEGSVFVVTLPLEAVDSAVKISTPVAMLDDEEDNNGPQEVKDQSGSPSSLSNSMSASPRYMILIIEDNADISYYIEQILKKSEYEIFHASNGEDGLDKARAIVPDLIITDVMMPKMDGFELCKRLKASTVTNHIPIIVITAKTTEADKLYGLDCGVECYLHKPFNAEELCKRVHNIFEQRNLLLEKVKKQMANEFVQISYDADKPLLNRRDDDFMTKVNEFINANMEQGSIDVDTLASHLCMTPKQFNRKLVHIVGSSAANYMIKLRIARACRLLKVSDEMISVVAQKCGFDNPSNFTRTFKDIVGCSPSVWRKKNME